MEELQDHLTLGEHASVSTHEMRMGIRIVKFDNHCVFVPQRCVVDDDLIFPPPRLDFKDGNPYCSVSELVYCWLLSKLRYRNLEEQTWTDGKICRTYFRPKIE